MADQVSKKDLAGHTRDDKEHQKNSSDTTLSLADIFLPKGQSFEQDGSFLSFFEPMTSEVATKAPLEAPFPSISPFDRDSEELDPKPKRPLSAYNYYFHYERKVILASLPSSGRKSRKVHGKIGFASLAKIIAARWKEIDETTLQHFEELAARDKARYTREMEAWKHLKREREAFMARRVDTKEPRDSLYSMEYHVLPPDWLQVPQLRGLSVPQTARSPCTPPGSGAKLRKRCR